MASFCLRQLSQVLTNTPVKKSSAQLLIRALSSKNIGKINNEQQIETISSKSLSDQSVNDIYWKDIDELMPKRNFSKNHFLKKSDYFKKIYESTQVNLNQNLKPSLKTPDVRDPNERIDELMPDDTEVKIDGRKKIPLTREGLCGKTAYYYEKKMSKLAYEGRVEEALAIFEEDMMLKDRVMPRKRTFVLLTGILAKCGHITKCFQLVRQMKILKISAEEKIYTNLFNVCANAYDKSYGLQRASILLNYMNENRLQLNRYTVKAAMKAFALCGDLPTTFALIDDAAQRMQLDTDCFNHLLMACISEKEAGFQRAIQVWQKMNEYNITPEQNTFNLLIRCTRDCGVGRPEDFLKTLGITDTDLSTPRLTLQNTGENHRNSRTLSVLDNNYNQTDEYISSNTEISQQSNNQCSIGGLEDRISNLNKDLKLLEKDQINLSFSIPNTEKPDSFSLSLNTQTEPNNVAVTSFKDLETPEGRLALLGGPKRLLEMMDDLKLSPQNKTYSMLLSCLPNTAHWEFWLLAEMEQRKLLPNVDFLNDILIRRSKRDKETMKDVLPFMFKLNLTPNMRTYAALALSCRTEDQAMSLIQDMKDANLEPNPTVMGHFISASAFKFSYKRKMLMMMEEMGQEPTLKTIEKIEDMIRTAKENIREAETSDPDSIFLTDRFNIPFRNFLNYYHRWLLRNNINLPKDPWRNDSKK